MDEVVKQHLIEYAKQNGWPYDDKNLIGIVIEEGYAYIYKEEVGKHRWWVEYLYVIEVDGMYIGYYDAETTGDMSARDSGYEFDPKSIHQVYPVEKTITVYERTPR